MVRVGEPAYRAPRPGLLSTLLLVCALLRVAPARGQGDATDDFQRHYDLAQELYQGRRYDEALVELQAAYAVRPEPRLLLNLGHACRRLGKGEDALGYYLRYRVEMPALSAADRNATDEYIALAQRQVDTAIAAAKPVQKVLPPLPALSPGAVRTGTENALLMGTNVPYDEKKMSSPRFWQHGWFWGTVGAVTVGIVVAATLSTQPWDTKVPSNIPIHDARF